MMKILSCFDAQYVNNNYTTLSHQSIFKNITYNTYNLINKYYKQHYPGYNLYKIDCNGHDMNYCKIDTKIYDAYISNSKPLQQNIQSTQLNNLLQNAPQYESHDNIVNRIQQQISQYCTRPYQIDTRYNIPQQSTLQANQYIESIRQRHNIPQQTNNVQPISRYTSLSITQPQRETSRLLAQQLQQEQSRIQMRLGRQTSQQTNNVQPISRYIPLSITGPISTTSRLLAQQLQQEQSRIQMRLGRQTSQQINNVQPISRYTSLSITQPQRETSRLLAQQSQQDTTVMMKYGSNIPLKEKNDYKQNHDKTLKDTIRYLEKSSAQIDVTQDKHHNLKYFNYDNSMDNILSELDGDIDAFNDSISNISVGTCLNMSGMSFFHDGNNDNNETQTNIGQD